MAYAKVPPAPLGKRDPGDIEGRSPEGVNPVYMIARLHAAESETAGGADAAGARSDNDEIGADKAAASRQR